MNKIIDKLAEKLHIPVTTIKYTISSLVSSALEFVVFFLLTECFCKNVQDIILIATICGRILGTILNFIINKYWCFKVYNKTIIQLVLYIILFGIKLFLSYYFVNLLISNFNISPTLIKIPVDVLLFVFGYLIQNYIIFRKKEPNEESKEEHLVD